MMFVHSYDYVWACEYMNQTMCVSLCVCMFVCGWCPWGGIYLCVCVQKHVTHNDTQYISNVNPSCRHMGVLWGNACDIVGVQYGPCWWENGGYSSFLLQHCGWAWKEYKIKVNLILDPIYLPLILDLFAMFFPCMYFTHFAVPVY